MPSKPTIPATCQTCGNTFLTWQYVINQGQRLFCGIACYRVSTQRSVTLCLMCESPITSQVATKFCTLTCYWTHLEHQRIETFWNRVQKTEGCWEYQGRRNSRGYGMVPIKGTSMARAHKFAWELTNGPVPDGLELLHECDNPPCVRPHPLHVHPGTHAENMADAAERRRFPYGEKWRQAHAASLTLTPDDVRSIRDQYATGGVSQRRLAKDYSISSHTVSLIVRRRSWVDVD